MEDVKKSFVENHEPSKVLRNGTFSTLSSRNAFYNSNFIYVQPRKVRLGYDRQGRDCYCEYNKIQEVLSRLFEDKTVYEQYLATDSSEHAKKYHGELWRGDFFMNTVPQDQRGMPPILVGLYRHVTIYFQRQNTCTYVTNFVCKW